MIHTYKIVRLFKPRILIKKFYVDFLEHFYKNEKGDGIFMTDINIAENCESQIDDSQEVIDEPKATKKKSKFFETFTKLWVSIVLICAVVDLQISYVLAFLGRENIAETLSVAVVTEVIGVLAVYMVRAYFDTKSEKKMELNATELELQKQMLNSSDEPDEDICDG